MRMPRRIARYAARIPTLPKIARCVVKRRSPSRHLGDRSPSGTDVKPDGIEDDETHR